MSKNLMSIDFIGVITALEPLSITQMDSKTPGVPMMPFPSNGELTGNQIYLPSTTLRGALRDCAVKSAIDALQGDDETLPFDEHTYFWNRVGGVKGSEQDKRGQDMLLASDIIATNPIIALFGGGEIFVEGKLAVGHARQRSKLRTDQLTFTHVGVRTDSFMREPGLFGQLDEASANRYLEYAGIKKEVSALRQQIQAKKQEVIALRRRDKAGSLDETEKATFKQAQDDLRDLESKVKAQKEESGFKNTINMPHSSNMIAAGNDFDHWLRTEKLTHLQLGCLLDAMRKFSVRCQIGGLINRGAGSIEVTYNVILRDERNFDETGNPVITDLGSITLKRGGFALNALNDVLPGALKAWDAAKRDKFPGMTFTLPKREKKA